MAEAPDLEGLYQQYKNDGFIVITLLETGGLNTWVDEFGINHPVVEDPGYGVAGRFVQGNTIGLPSMSLIAPGGEVLLANRFPSVQDIEAALPASWEGADEDPGPDAQ